MLLAVTLLIASVLGVIYGIRNKNKPIVIVSVIMFIAIIAIWIYFYNNPY